MPYGFIQFAQQFAGAGVALRPATPVEPFLDLLAEVDMVLVMTVEPGFGGQEFLDLCLPKIRRARELGVRIAVGSDAGSLGVDHGRGVGEELAIFVDAGFSIEAAVACSAGVGGELLGLPDGGEIRAGRPASFIAVDGPPERLPGNLATSRHFRFPA